MKFLALVFLLLIGIGSAGLSQTAMQQPGIEKAIDSIDLYCYQVAILPSNSATDEDISNAIEALVSTYGDALAQTNYTGKLQIGITDRPGRIVSMVEVSAPEIENNYQNQTWLDQVPNRAQVWKDDTRNYDPYGNRYTPFPSGKGELGAMLLQWLGESKPKEEWAVGP